eukprot:CAMPEP_0177484714 /NCGR_PEP_ID=MMETSP0369-20130122/28174_1 /TAXON_ID=447022 ORGANISM="Scrippsiella hangoei-like, Strain SHHI-4" /NCGR_SAMPLE_ID=MMETSP0369 /ASSEMBLY_ACC=CAM_ASM_000364 /LENGTH=97 /DNA_ID=CAMNT_0018960843 /DNA_START=31 /DNA_END=322 /DNA_ORIENTATION=+
MANKLQLYLDSDQALARSAGNYKYAYDAIATTTVGSYALVLSGSCNGFDGFYEQAGLTASGSPWFKKVDAGRWIYHDPDCSGNGSLPEWILDIDPPS